MLNPSLSILPKETHIIKYTPLIQPRKHPIRPIHRLQAILLAIPPKLIIILQRPRQRPDDIHPILHPRLHHLGQKILIIQRPLEIEPLRRQRSLTFLERVEAVFCD